MSKDTVKLTSKIIFLLSFVFASISTTQAASDDFGRLFTTPDERKKLQTLRNSAPEIDEEIEIIVEEFDVVEEEVKPPRDINGITLNGVVYRKGNKSTVWLNGSNSYEGNLSSEYYRINTKDINDKKVSVTVPEFDLQFDLKVGQTYEPNDERLLDIVEDGDDVEISRN
jgi:hypothetical protein